ncbi:hypothetical protein RB601_009802 [Gaeumannomyces tritici]
MMRLPWCLALLSSLFQAAAAQDLSTAISDNPKPSYFKKFLDANPDIFDSIIPDGWTNVTILVPTNGALNRHHAETGNRLESMSEDRIHDILRYHTILGPLTSSNLTAAQDDYLADGDDYSADGDDYSTEDAYAPRLSRRQQGNAVNTQGGQQGGQQGGLPADTALSIAAGVAGAAAVGTQSQSPFDILRNVIIISQRPLGLRRRRIRSSSGSDGDTGARGGLASESTITFADGSWDRGYYQLIDRYLEIPDLCSKTSRRIRSLDKLDEKMRRNDLWPLVDNAFNVTCLAPSNQAFRHGERFYKRTLQYVLEFHRPVPVPREARAATDQRFPSISRHVLPGVTYTYYLRDGQVLKSLDGGDVRVSIRDGYYYFNDAKVIKPDYP